MPLTVMYSVKQQNLVQENEDYKTFCQIYGNELTKMEYKLISHQINKELEAIVFSLSQSNFTNKTQILEEVHDIVFNQNKNSSDMITTDNKPIRFYTNFLKQLYNGDEKTILKIQFFNKMVTSEHLDKIKPYIKHLFFDRFRSLESIFKRRYDFLKNLNFERTKKETLDQDSTDTNENSKTNSSQSFDNGLLKQSFSNINDAIQEMSGKNSIIQKISED